MPRARGWRNAGAWAMLAVLLFAQMAVAMYACPAWVGSLLPGQAQAGPLARSALPTLGQAAADPAGLADMTGMADRGDMAGMADCAQMSVALDQDAPHLCAQHCRMGQQSDQSSTLSVPALVLTSLYALPAAPLAALAALSPALYCVAAPAGARLPGAPPLAILHCCFRD